MPRFKTLRRPAQLKLIPRVKVWLECDGHYAFGFGLAQILEAVERAGSIKHAARELGKSYRYIWGRIADGERVLGRPLVHSQVGGKGLERSELSAAARGLLKDFMALRATMFETLQQQFAHRFRLPAAKRRF